MSLTIGCYIEADAVSQIVHKFISTVVSYNKDISIDAGIIVIANG